MMFNIFLLVFHLISRINALPQGAPIKVCQSMTPLHGGGIAPQTDQSPFSIKLRRQNGGVIVTISSNIQLPFEGFMIQGRTPNRELIGYFETQDTRVHTIDCGLSQDTLTHSNTDQKNAIEVRWTPPENYEGVVLFNSTIAQGYNTFWVGVESVPLQIGKRFVNDPIPENPNDRITTAPSFVPLPPKGSIVSSDPFYEDCGVKKLCFGAPDGCVATRNCKAATAIMVKGDKYDFELKATGKASWVGIGLSDDDKMGDDSVIECARKGNSVKAYMSWTRRWPSFGAARLSNPQLGIQLLNGSAVDDEIYCKVRRESITKVNGTVFDLIDNQYHILIASGSQVSENKVEFHDLTYLASGEKQSLSDVSDLAGASKILIRLHGSFMLIAWIGTVSIGTLMARYYRNTWVGSQLWGKDIWFVWHRAFMVLTWLLTMVAFVLIFVELKAWSEENNPHAILGTITTILCFLQPIGAYFRPHPGTPKRPIFNWVHWLFGNAAHIVGIVTVFFAVKLTKAELPDFMDWILVGYVAFHVIVHLTLSIMGCLSERSSERRITSFPMKDLGGSGRTSAYTDRNADAPYSTFRKLILSLYIVVIIAFVVVLIIITALAPIEHTWTIIKDSVSNSN